MLQSNGILCQCQRYGFKATYLGLRVGLGTMITVKTCQCENDNRHLDTYTHTPPYRLPASQAQIMRCMMNHNAHADGVTVLPLRIYPPSRTSKAVAPNKTCLAFRVSWSCVSRQCAPIMALIGHRVVPTHEAVPLFSFPITHDPSIILVSSSQTLTSPPYVSYSPYFYIPQLPTNCR
jgi:hypothetical protein